jgi:hypothetical protein
MHPTPRPWLARAALLVGAVVIAAGVPGAAGAANPHQAAVIVETGGETHRVVITFTEDSITGIDALQRAGADPVVYAFTGQGGAVCRLFGAGRDAGPNCLGGQDGDNRYWAYFRAPAGSSGFTYSQVGAGTADVRDGDVEGWRFGTGQAPQYVSLQSLAPPPPAKPPASGNGGAAGATRPTPPPFAIDGTSASPNPSASTLPATGGASTPSSTTKGTAGSTTGARVERSGDRGDDDRRAAATETALASSNADHDDGNSATSLVWLALLLTVIAVAIVVARRVRRRPTAGA